jgi:hypothetical protein
MYCGYWVRKGVEIGPSYTAGKMLARGARNEFNILALLIKIVKKSAFLMNVHEKSPDLIG